MDYTVERLQAEAYSRLDIEKIPKSPGCYIFQNNRREIIYIGKSKSLRNRVRQYFHTKDSSHSKYADLAREVHNIEVIVTDTETNALILECRLIKKYQPRYNSQLKKSKVYPFIRIDLQQTYPSITIMENMANDGCKYYGCFYSQDDAVNTLELLNSIWLTPVCCKKSFDVKHRPCLNYHLQKCCAPCGGEIDIEAYRQKVVEIVKFLNGNYRKTMSRLKREMEAASQDFNFEKAARLRDSIFGLDRLKKKQKKLCTALDNKDVYMFFRAFGEKCFSLFFIRNGVTLSRADFQNINDLETEKLAGLIDNNMTGKTTVDDGLSLTSNLLEIGAQKLFIPVSSRMNRVKILKELEAAHKEFIE